MLRPSGLVSMTALRYNCRANVAAGTKAHCVLQWMREAVIRFDITHSAYSSAYNPAITETITMIRVVALNFLESEVLAQTTI